MLYAATALIAFQCVGELIADAMALPVPGVVIGMLLLLVTLGWWARARDLRSLVQGPLGQVAKALHDHFGLLFVPAGAGIVDKFDRLAVHLPGLLATVLLSTAATIAVTGLIASVRAGGVLSGTASAE